MDSLGPKAQLRNARRNTGSARAKVLIVEMSFKKLYEGQPLFDRIYDTLTRIGFAYHGNFQQLLNRVDGSVLQADGIFINANAYHI